MPNKKEDDSSSDYITEGTSDSESDTDNDTSSSSADNDKCKRNFAVVILLLFCCCYFAVANFNALIYLNSENFKISDYFEILQLNSLMNHHYVHVQTRNFF